MEDKQQEFIAWLGEKLQAQDEGDLKKKLEGLGKDEIRQAYEQFLSEADNTVASARLGGKLEYIECLKQFKKGGSIDCGCGGMKIKSKGGKLGKHQLGGMVMARHTDKPAEGTPVKAAPQNYYARMDIGNGQMMKSPLGQEAMQQVRQVGDKYYDMTGFDDINYDFDSKQYSVNQGWFDKTMRERGSVGVGHTDAASFLDWRTQNKPIPREVYPQQVQPPVARGQSQYITPTNISGGGKSGWQGSTQERDAVFAKERMLKAQSTGHRSYQKGGTLKAKPQPNGPQGQGGMQQPMTPEQVQDQKVDEKAMELTMKKNPAARQAEHQAMLTPLELLQQEFDKERLKMNPKPTMTLISKGGKTYGSGKEVK